MADFFADRLLTDEAAIRAVCEYEPVTARNIRDYIKGLLRKLGGKETTLERALTLYNKALKDVAAKAQADAEGRMRLKTAPETQKQESGLRLGDERQYSTQDEVLAMAGINWVKENASVKQQLIDHSDELNSMEPIVSVEYAGETGTALINLIMQEVPKIGGELMKHGNITFNFDETGASRIVHHSADNDEILAASLAAPYVAKYGKLIAGQKNHENQGVTTLTYAAPILLNGEPVNEGVIIQFTNKGRPRAVNVGLQTGGSVKLQKKKPSKVTAVVFLESRKGRLYPQ